MAGPSVGGKHFIQGAIAQDLHTDGRKRLVYRPISVETGVIPQANGSARVRTGTTDVIASVKRNFLLIFPSNHHWQAELGKPYLLQPGKGRVIINVDCSPAEASVFKGRGGKELSTELSIALQRCLLGSTIGTSTTISNSAAPQRCLLGSKSGTGVGIDCSSLMIAEGKLCWELYVDGLVVSSDGNLLDALGAAIKAALNNTCIPKVYITTAASADDEKPEIDISDEEFLQFDTSGIPVIVTLTKVGSHFIVDATSEEESQMSLAVSISINRNGHICGLTKQGGAGLDHRVILDIISLAKHVSEQ
ncbi:putative exosome complex exonuclease RRP42 isoform X1 [Macadamia integrifolia]|uniref:putative exosome complex exonuclease RRP42 isoform X1 n=1 Tax=Macadamia integrifolia TaxID=60698 RepID=UPI001C500D90|nr:putative exosome complex exonuclease RRP42 isoform X1 [Macadamia integrifolia]XP_042499481.1 putative exosome complex exonuclease RRP42 isoform X1 [Macadamia integrifolia]